MPTLDDLADQADATAYGYGTIGAGMFARASARVRRFATSRGYSVDADTFTVTGRAPILLLGNRPVREVTTVTEKVDDTELSSDEWVLRVGGTLEVADYGCNVEVVYEGGFDPLPDYVVEAVCTIASRMTNTSAAASSGVQQETGGSESVTFGFDAYTGISDLTKGELAALGSMFPQRAGVVVLR